MRAARDPLGDRREIGAAGGRGGRRHVRRGQRLRSRRARFLRRRIRRRRARTAKLGGDALVVRAHDRHVLRVVEQERVVPVCGDDLRVRDGAVVVDQRLHDLARARGSEAPVGRERDDEEAAGRGRQRPREIAAGGRGRIEVVERLGDAQVGVRIVVLGELLALMPQVRFDLELGLERELEPFPQRAAELLLHLLVGQVGDMPDHPRHDEPSPRLRPRRLEVAVVKIGVACGSPGARLR